VAREKKFKGRDIYSYFKPAVQLPPSPVSPSDDNDRVIDLTLSDDNDISDSHQFTLASPSSQSRQTHVNANSIDFDRLHSTKHHWVDTFTGIIYSKRLSKPECDVWHQIKGFDHNNGYKQLDVDGSKPLWHRYIWETHYNQTLSPEVFIDHIDGNKQNNSIFNLRIVNASGNNQNKHRKRTSQFQYKGVGKAAQGKYRATIKVWNKTYSATGFDTQEEAARWYDIQAKHANQHENCAFRLNFE